MVTAIGGGGGGGGREGDGLPAAAAARGAPRASVGDELVGQHGLWSFESLKRAQIA